MIYYYYFHLFFLIFLLYNAILSIFIQIYFSFSEFRQLKKFLLLK